MSDTIPCSICGCECFPGFLSHDGYQICAACYDEELIALGDDPEPICDGCNGRGRTMEGWPCEDCDGTGRYDL